MANNSRLNPWDAYAPFYDWENARTMGRRDVQFWRDVVQRERGPVLELGCGTGRVLLSLAAPRRLVVGIDRSSAMLARLRVRVGRLRRARPPALLQGDIRALPVRSNAFCAVIAPYGMLQSLTSDRALAATLAESARVLRPGGLFGIDLVPDLPTWPSYRRRVRFRGRSGTDATITLVESVRQDRRRGVTIFDEEFIERRRRRVTRRRFALTFRTLPMQVMLARLERAGLAVDAVLGDYRGSPWDVRAPVWVILARKR